MEIDHQTFVRTWLDATASGATTDRLLRLFESAFGALWLRAHVTIGDVTLAAITDRVLLDAAERHPLLTNVTVGDSGLRFDVLPENMRTAAAADVYAAMEAVLVGFLSVLGNLTAEILSPGLHSALTNVGPPGEDASS